jgi:3-methyladenine DNA glycosylase AlkD
VTLIDETDIEAILICLDAQLEQTERSNTPALRLVRKDLSRRLAKADASVILNVSDALVKRGTWADRMIAYEIVGAHRAAFATLDEGRLIRWSRGLTSWGTVDLFGCTLAGQAWREGVLSDAVIDEWSHSPDRWMRRLSLVCTVPLNIRSRGGHGDIPRTLRICEALVDDRDDMVVKALSWALRELAKRDPGPVRDFLSRNHERLASRVVREVTTKLTTGKKNV